jgi:hypothetical protein
MRIFLLALLLLSGCAAGRFVTPTNAFVARFEPTAGGFVFRRCRVHLGWTEEDLRSECGEPMRTIPSARPDESCFVYPSLAHAFAVSEVSAPFFVVCTSDFESKKGKEMRVVDVVGVSRVPNARTSTTSR